MAEDIAISVNDVSKMYKLYDNPMDRLKESLGLSRKKKYKEHYALNHVSFQVHKGETVGIIGTTEGSQRFWSWEPDLTENIPDLKMYISTEA